MPTKITIDCSTHPSTPINSPWHCSYRHNHLFPPSVPSGYTPPYIPYQEKVYKHDDYTKPFYYNSFSAFSYNPISNNFAAQQSKGINIAKSIIKGQEEFTVNLIKEMSEKASGRELTDKEMEAVREGLIKRQEMFKSASLEEEHARIRKAIFGNSEKDFRSAKPKKSQSSENQSKDNSPSKNNAKEEIKQDNHSKFAEHIQQSFLNEISSTFDKIASKQRLTPEEIAYGQQKIREYYDYLSKQSIKYGDLALDVLDQRTSFGETANIHLKTAAKNNGFDQAKIDQIIEEYPIYLAARDAEMRAKPSVGNALEYRKIADYHYDGLQELYGLPKEAWGGALFEEFGGSGSWMVMSGYATDIDLDFTDISNAINDNKMQNGVSARKAFAYLWSTQNAACEGMRKLPEIPYHFNYGLPIGITVEDIRDSYEVGNFLFANPAARSFWVGILSKLKKDVMDNASGIFKIPKDSELNSFNSEGVNIRLYAEILNSLRANDKTPLEYNEFKGSTDESCMCYIDELLTKQCYCFDI